MGATPASMANAASVRMRPGWDQALRMRAALMTPTPGSARSSGASVAR